MVFTAFQGFKHQYPDNRAVFQREIKYLFKVFIAIFQEVRGIVFACER